MLSIERSYSIQHSIRFIQESDVLFKQNIKKQGGDYTKCTVAVCCVSGVLTSRSFYEDAVSLRVDIFDYNLPEELIAREPCEKRDESRMMVIERNTCTIEHRHFCDITDFLTSDDVMVVNDTKVFPARLIGKRAHHGGNVEALLLRELKPLEWLALVRPGKKIKKGETLSFGNTMMQGEVTGYGDVGERIIRFSCKKDFWEVINRIGQTPLPPYIIRSRKKEEGIERFMIEDKPFDRERYQTVYARVRGSIAAPTAGFHFTDALLERIEKKGVRIVKVTLHVGEATFKPVATEYVEQHKMGTERYAIDEETCDLLNDTKKKVGKVVAVGTTSVRTLESVADKDGYVSPGTGETSLMICPGYTFKVVGGLVTNFHLPRSTLLMLVSAFAGTELIKKAYKEAVARAYHFYSYGDAMLIV